MGIARGAIRVLMTEANRRPFEGSIITLGRQDVFVTYEQLLRLADIAGFAAPRVIEPEITTAANWAEKGCISDSCLLRYLGFGDVQSMDVSDYEHATQIFDLNNPDLPEELVGAFDVVLDGGTLEHVFHVPNVLRSIVRMLKPGGRVIHMAPSSNHMDHGFYMFSPTLFADYYAANGFSIETLQVLRYTEPIVTSPWILSDYPIGNPFALGMGQLDNAMYSVICIATKGPDSTGDNIPQQSFYQMSPPGPPPAVAPATVGQAIKAVLKKIPLAVALNRYLWQLRRRYRKGLGLRVVARY